MHYLIYKITNRLNNKIYVGKHKTENKDDDYFGSGVILGRAVEKHGKENFTKEILFECSSEEEMNNKEADIVDEEFIARDDTYNVMLGGCGGFSHINSTGKNIYKGHSETSRKNSTKGCEAYHRKFISDEEFRLSEIEKNRIKLKRARELCPVPFLGKHHKEETKRKISQIMKGKNSGTKNGVYGKHWITNGIDNKMSIDIPSGWRLGRV